MSSRRKQIKWTLIATVVMSLFMAGPASAVVPKLLTYQGVLKNDSGSLLTGTYSITFKLYNAATGGTALWTETHSTVSVTSGQFSVELGGTTTLDLAFNEQYYLGVKVGSDAEMTPRIKLTSVGYAYNSDDVENSFTETDHAGLSHMNVEGVKSNTTNLAKTNFKLDAYSLATANSMGDLIVDAFNDATGIDAGSSSDYSWRGSPNYDVKVGGGDIDDDVKAMLHGNGTDASTTFTDSSNSAHTVSVNGATQIDTAQSKFGGASMLGDGTSDYLTIASHADFNIGTADFTIDFWMRTTTTGSEQWLFDQEGATNNLNLDFHTPGGGRWDLAVGGTTQSTTNSINANQWYHVAVVRTSGTVKLFLDGTQINTNLTASGSISQGALDILGKSGTSASLNGWMDEFRYSKGVARWTSNFTPPTSEYAAASSATVVSVKWEEPTAPAEAMLIADATLNTGSITYYLSRNNGTNWTVATSEAVTDISGQPSGSDVRWKAVITGDAELDAVAVAL